MDRLLTEEETRACFNKYEEQVKKENRKIRLKKANFCIQKHINTNHYYDSKYPYKFHLYKVVGVLTKFYDKLKNKSNLLSKEDLIFACLGHDLIEDTRTSYNEVVSELGKDVANVIYAVTCEKGKTRNDRNSSKYYKDISINKSATLVKLCDRIANLEYSILAYKKYGKNKMFSTYLEEHSKFVKYLYTDNQFEIMFEHLKNLFINTLRNESL